MLETDKDLARHLWEDVFNSGKVDELDQYFTDDYVLHDLVNFEDRSLSDLKGMIQRVRVLTPTARAEVKQQLAAEDNHVVTQFLVSVPGYDSNPWTAHAAGEKLDAYSFGEGSSDVQSTPLQLNGVSISRTSEGQFAETWLLLETRGSEKETFGFWRWPPW